MKQPDMHHLDRRSVIHGGLFLGMASILSACGGRTANLPKAVWPDDVRRTASVPPARTVPLGTPAPSQPVRVPSGLPSGVLPRSAWTSSTLMPSRLTANGHDGRMGTITRITIHHDALDSTGLRSQGDAARRLNVIRNGQMSRKPEPFADIGYHYIIDPQGRVWEGRSIQYQGAHVRGQNENNLGVMLMGHFDQHRPTAAAIEALDAFVASQMARYGISLSRVKTHQELAATECPGRNLQRYMVQSRARGGNLARA